MSDPKYIYDEIDANEWDLYELRDDHPTHPGYHMIATIECDEDVVEQITNALNASTCTWTQDADDGFWYTECGGAFEFMVGGPEENGHRFCPYCGGWLH